MVLSTLCDRTDAIIYDSPLALTVEDLTATTDDLELIFEKLLGQFFPFRGFILFDADGHLVRSTTKAHEFSILLNKATPGKAFGPLDSQCVDTTPPQIETLCKLLQESCDDYPNYTLQLYDTTFLPGGIRLQLNAEWIELIDQPTKCILVTIEDLTQVAHQRAVSDTYRYGLTSRETDVWKLYLQGLSYRQVSEELFISLNTVKKHMKSIFSKCHIECRCHHLV